jgi:glycosyltransferase involved in cell wall biosynthesis
MRVLIVNTSEKTGGAAVAANRLMEALINNGVKAKMLVRDKQTDCLTVVSAGDGWRQRWHFLWERWRIFMAMHFSKTHLFEADIANVGTDITTLPEFKEADIIHLHWINQGFLSLNGIQKILSSGKPVVWTMHDIWPATAICHYARGCCRYQNRCESCPLLPRRSVSDLSAVVWRRKNEILRKYHISFVACSRWLEGEAKKSALLKGQRVTNIPNPINSHVFCPSDKQQAREALGLPLDKHVILFVSQRVTDKRKGLDYLVEAVNRMAVQDSSLKDNTAIAVLGGHSEEVADLLPLPVFPLGYVSDESKIVKVYNAADVFVLPSLEDNLPNTIMEAMACGVPCVGFNIGGIPEMIGHLKSGYVAKAADADDLARGIKWVLDFKGEELSKEARRKVLNSYSQQSVAIKYIELYQETALSKSYKL